MKRVAIIADDSEYFCLALKLEFEKSDFDVITVGNGPALRKAINELQKDSKAIIIADIQMPIENGDLVLNDLESELKSKGHKAFLLSSDPPEKVSSFPYLLKSLSPSEITQKAISE
jgi:DNA-binding response OmpR family regulator